MRHFFSKSTIMAEIWCKKCHADTLWKFADGRPLYCTRCNAQADPPKPKKTKPPKPDSLFE